MNNVLYEITFGDFEYQQPESPFVKVVNDLSLIVYPAVLQTKLDGVRCIWVVDTLAGTAVNQSRNGNPFVSVEWMADDIVSLARSLSSDRHVTIDGELTAGDFQNTLRRVRQKREQAKDVVFTAFEYTDESIHSYAQKAAKMNATKGCIQSTIVESAEQVVELSQRLVSDGEEGAVVKNFDDNTWCRVKPVQTADLIVIGHKNGKSVVVDCGGVDVTVHVGCDSDSLPAIGRIVEVAHQGMTKRGSLRSPVFHSVRDDADFPGIKI